MEKDIKCPHCGYVRDADTDDYGDDGDSFIEECRGCEKKFEVTLSVSHSWDSVCLKGEHILVSSERHTGWSNCKVCDEFLKDIE